MGLIIVKFNTIIFNKKVLENFYSQALSFLITAGIYSALSHHTGTAHKSGARAFGLEARSCALL